jgi:hypothetical protein
MADAPPNMGSAFGTPKQNIADFLTRFGQRPTVWANNWALFWALNHTCRKALNLPFDQDLIDDVIGDYLDRVYCGDGWYDDGAERGVLSRLALDQRIPDLTHLNRIIWHYEANRNKKRAAVNWRFTTNDARLKLRRLYPSISS